MKTKTPRVPKPRIESVRIEHKHDESPDTSWLGEYSRQPKEYAIDREARGDMERGELRWFNPGSVESFNPKAEWIVKELRIAAAFGIQTTPETIWSEAMGKNAQADYQRMEALNAGDWSFIGIIAKAVIRMRPDSPSQVIRSGGLWGVESDSGKDYFAETAKEQLAELDLELAALGFTTRQIKHAFGNVQNPD